MDSRQRYINYMNCEKSKLQLGIGWSALFLRVEFILCFLMAFFTITKKPDFVSLCLTISFLTLLVFFIHTLSVYKLQKNEFINLLLLVAIVTLSFFAILQNPLLQLLFEYCKKYFMFCSTIIFLFIASKVTVREKTIKYILAINILLSCLYMYAYFFGERAYKAGGLTFNFGNPNFTAMWILQTIFYMVIATLYYKKPIMRVLCVGFAAMLSLFLFETLARSCLIALACFVLLVLYIFMKRNVRISKFLVAILVLLPIIFVLIYFVLIRSGDIQTFGFMESEGKGLYSRESIWTYAFDMINAYPIFGAYYQISGGTGMSQMHNTHIDVWASYGTVVFVLLMIYMARVCIGISARCVSKFQTVALLAFLASIVMGLGEAALFSGSQGLYVLTGSFLLLARYTDWDIVKK